MAVQDPMVVMSHHHRHQDTLDMAVQDPMVVMSHHHRHQDTLDMAVHVLPGVRGLEENRAVANIFAVRARPVLRHVADAQSADLSNGPAARVV